MSFYSFTNIPAKADKDVEIVGSVNGQNVSVHIVDKQGGHWGISSSYVGDHMLERPEALRQMIADSVANAIRAGREAGYAQAQRDIRLALGIK